MLKINYKLYFTKAANLWGLALHFFIISCAYVLSIWVGKAEERRRLLRISELETNAHLRSCKFCIFNFEFWIVRFEFFIVNLDLLITF